MNHNPSSVPTPERNGAPLRDHVVVGVDGSGLADLAVEQAADEAAFRGVPLEVLHVVDRAPDREEDQSAAELREEAESLVRTAAERARLRHPDLAIVTTVALARIVPTLEQATDRAALVVLGSRGLGGFVGLLLGSVSLSVAAAARCPILVVRAPHANVPLDAPGTVVVGVSGIDCAPAVEAAFAAAQARGVALRAVHAWAPPVSPAAPYAAPLWVGDDGRKNAEATLAAALEPVMNRYRQVPLTEQIVCDIPTHALLAAGDEAELVVLAAHRRHGRFGPNLGRVTHTLLHHSKAPVLLVPIA
ncbi:universal stress protein [Embleya sp. NPDC055664]|uniref:universal stress protein n=1 Tax=Embleya sp. NPDC059237 TaxID=3346784 RepID=UPI00369E0360